MICISLCIVESDVYNYYLHQDAMILECILGNFRIAAFACVLILTR